MTVFCYRWSDTRVTVIRPNRNG